MSDDPELERRLDAMFGSLRPGAEFEDRLRARLRPRRPWWNRPAVLGLAAVIPVLVIAVFAVPQLERHPSGASTSSFQTRASSRATIGAALDRPACASPGALAEAQSGKTAPPAPSTPSPTPCP